ncbi:MAG: VTT domain-containing protein [Firmicutes bacterium]|nr:VTT domain-containing protein [Bacillota bacterium]
MDGNSEKIDEASLDDKRHLSLKHRIGKFVFVFFMIAGFTIGMYFVFRAFNLDIFSDEPVNLGAQGAALFLIFLFIYVAQALTLNLLPGTTTFFVSIIAYNLFNQSFLITFLASVPAVLLGSVALYFLGRYGGRKLLYWLFSKDALERRLGWFERNGTKGVPWLFLIPFFPTDLLCLTCGAAKMKFWQFMLIVVVFRPIEVGVLLVYRLVVPGLLEATELWEQIIIVNIIVINIVLLVIYHKTLLGFFNKTFNPRRYERDQAIAAKEAATAALAAYKAAMAVEEEERKAEELAKKKQKEIKKAVDEMIADTST